MGTANFLYNDTLYAINNDEDTDHLLEDIMDCINYRIDGFADLNYTSIHYDGKTRTNDNRNFEGVVLVNCDADITIGGLINNSCFDLSVSQKIIVRHGYHDGFNLDRCYTIYGTDIDEIDICKIIHYIKEWDELSIRQYFTSDFIYEDYIDKYVKLELDKELKAIINEFDSVYHTLGKEYFGECGVIAQFSNGETMYREVDGDD